MDQVKIGKFIASLRRQAGLTQENLGERLGVTNKTISRWENGNYMPDIEMLPLLAKEFKVSINELLAGEKISDEDFRKVADDNIMEAVKTNAFSWEEQKTYFKKKWRKEHIPLFVFLGLILIASFVLSYEIHTPWLSAAIPLIALAEYCYQNNKMMIYVEKKLYNRYRDND